MPCHRMKKIPFILNYDTGVINFWSCQFLAYHFKAHKFMVDNKILMAKKYFANTGIDGSD